MKKLYGYFSTQIKTICTYAAKSIWYSLVSRHKHSSNNSSLGSQSYSMVPYYNTLGMYSPEQCVWREAGSPSIKVTQHRITYDVFISKTPCPPIFHICVLSSEMISKGFVCCFFLHYISIVKLECLYPVYLSVIRGCLSQLKMNALTVSHSGQEHLLNY